MNLQEYLTQTDPRPMPHVKVERHEYRVICHYGQDLTLIEINGLPEFQYIIKEGHNTVWTKSKDGNPERCSCFSLTEF